MRAVRFGVFEVDLRASELRKKGIRNKLQDQPFVLRVTLLKQRGEIITREEIRRTLWPDGTFIDFNHGLGSAINKLREALGDPAANPRFVETVPRRGYRFIAPIETVSDDRWLQVKLLKADRIAPPARLNACHGCLIGEG